MFTQTWKKYLPVIALLLKRSDDGEQTLNLNHTDFERAAGGRKIKFSFTQLEIIKGRVSSNSKQTPVAKELAMVLQEDTVIAALIAGLNLEFSMSNDFRMVIKKSNIVAEAVVEETPDAIDMEATGEAEAEVEAEEVETV